MQSAYASDRAAKMAALVEAFGRDVVAPCKRDPGCGANGPSEQLDRELRDKARVAGLAAIFHGIKGRVIRCMASSAQAAERAKILHDLPMSHCHWPDVDGCGTESAEFCWASR